MGKADRGKYIKISAVVLAVVLAVIAAALLYKTAEKQWIYPLSYSDSVEKYADAFGLERSLVYALIKTESGFDAKAESAKGAKGLMQLTDATAAFIAVKFGRREYDLFDADTNVSFGCYYLWYLSKKFSALPTVLAAYNAGEGNVSSWLKDGKYSSDGKTLFAIPYGETEKHVEKTLRYKEKYQKIHEL